jgi:transcriptional regulator with PAS, ATPase and Fis domain
MPGPDRRGDRDGERALCPRHPLSKPIFFALFLLLPKKFGLSPRSHAPFLPVNCGAIPVDLAESELFGYARGAYTGAVTSYPGLIREAEGGTLFLDEIDCLPAAGQVKLFRFLQDKEYRALGTTGMLKANVRVIAASNVAIDVAIREGRFRQDLYYRLNTIPFHLPPLRSRREDLPLLMRHFLRKYTAEHGKHITGFRPCSRWPSMIGRGTYESSSTSSSAP